MATLHETSHDCRAHAQRHGGRRRRCARCGRTWSVHRRRSGRRHRRISNTLPRMALVDHEPIRRLSQRCHCSRDSMYRRIRQACERLVRPAVALPLPTEEPLILLADGLWFAFRRRVWVIYTTALRPVAADRAHFLAPVLLEGRECSKRWRQAFDSALPSEHRKRICALVTDGFPGGRTIAAENSWVLQRCHWHLLSVLRGFLGVRRKTTRGRSVRKAIYRLAREALRTPAEARAQEICRELSCLAQSRRFPTRLRYLVGGLVRDSGDFRAYLRFPEMRLPTTISAIESMHGRMRDAVFCVNSPTAVLLRLSSLLRLEPSITCQAAKIPQD